MLRRLGAIVTAAWEPPPWYSDEAVGYLTRPWTNDLSITYVICHAIRRAYSAVNLHHSSGILAHLTSLPSDFGVGDLGDSARAFADFLSAAGQSLWQILPTVPIGEGNSPYKSPSTFAGNTLLLSPRLLFETGLIGGHDLGDARRPQSNHIHYAGVKAVKESLLATAHSTFMTDAGREERALFDHFCDQESFWLKDYALFEVLTDLHDGQSWMDWGADLARRDPDALQRIEVERHDLFSRIQFGQYLFQKQWHAFREYVNRLRIGIIGDLPIYVATDSADVWAHRSLFQLDDAGRPLVVAGVPPDYFSETGQYWGNPIYDWENMDRDRFAWWISRVKRLLDQVDVLRIDHFRGIQAYWEIPADEETAVNGRWVQGPADRLLSALRDGIGALPVIAEDLGVITDDVTDLMNRFGLPGMAVLQFALMGGENDALLPERLESNRMAYTGTHDNDTFLGWWKSVRDEAAGAAAETAAADHPEGDGAGMDSAGTDGAEHARRIAAFTQVYLGLEGVADEEIPWRAMASVMNSDAGCVIIPIQDVLSLDSSGRVNTPGTERGNWEWRLMDDQITDRHAERLRRLTEQHDRLGTD